MQLVFDDSKTVIGIFRFESLHTMGFWSCIQYECLTYKYILSIFCIHICTKICYLSSWYFAADFLKLCTFKSIHQFYDRKGLVFIFYFSDRNFMSVRSIWLIGNYYLHCTYYILRTDKGQPVTKSEYLFTNYHLQTIFN